MKDLRNDSPAKPSLSIALIGTRGVPASYGGFETAVEEIGWRLADRGHVVTVYGREAGDVGSVYRGMRRVTLPAVRRKSLETLTHTAVSSAHAVTRVRPDAAVVFNAANSPLVPVLRMARIPVALHMDGLEWKRSKWGRVGKAYYRLAESFGVRQANALIADSIGIADYYRQQFDAPTELIKYGAPQIFDAPVEGIERLGFRPGDYHLVVARFEPENHVYEIVQGYTQSNAQKPLVVVGSAPYSEGYTASIEALVEADRRVHLLGPVYDQELLDALYFHAHTYVHGHSVGGTNPSLLRAIGAGTAVISYDVSFNHDVVDGEGWFFTNPSQVSSALEEAEESSEVSRIGSRLRKRASEHYTWDGVADLYEEMLYRLARGQLSGPARRGARRSKVEWT
ncbi:DUF1972 domain-containing protein [Gordonia alkanivorans]|uniref:DUF1972 domain-containing protein n=1 Tax=Gordonia alkanivorans TaxID=84096 RepID=UPI00244B7E98|nr:DUF1972 domain-containing protein [Gordonia alkanivorans]MDH3017407.1 DUF1972 domain-containing protein [Gordonia alkanivorans]MDH3042733.1 DUF1972 domain-containing protein [Gordonia alkanivorans]